MLFQLSWTCWLIKVKLISRKWKHFLISVVSKPEDSCSLILYETCVCIHRQRLNEQKHFWVKDRAATSCSHIHRSTCFTAVSFTCCSAAYNMFVKWYRMHRYSIRGLVQTGQMETSGCVQYKPTINTDWLQWFFPLCYFKWWCVISPLGQLYTCMCFIIHSERLLHDYI